MHCSGCAAILLFAAAHAVSASGYGLDKVCDPRGLDDQTPPSCWKETANGTRRYLPNVYGGPATLDQCVFGQPAVRGGGVFGNGGSCSSGALFGYSGVDGPTNSLSKMIGWFVNGSYSVHLWLGSSPRFLKLGFGGLPS